jgi:NADH:ubiquinone oxidoreductase subunit E
MQGQCIEALESLQAVREYYQKNYWTAIVATLGMSTYLLSIVANFQRTYYMQDQGILAVRTFEEPMGKLLKDYYCLN